MIKTLWGYDIDANTLPDILTVEEFNLMTANRFEGDVRIESAIKASQDAVRNFCGWHVAPAVDCIFESRFIDKRMILNGADLLIQLPVRQINTISGIEIDDVAYEDYVIEASGILRVFDVNAMTRKSKIKISYNAGSDIANIIREVIANGVTHALSTSYGIQQETTGSVSVSYSANWSNTDKASSLSIDSRETLTPYRVQGVF